MDIETPENEPELTKRIPRSLFDAAGNRLKGKIPKPLTGEFLRKCHHRGSVVDTGNPELDAEGNVRANETLVRMQVPWLATLLVYNSPLQMAPVCREYLVYAPPSLAAAVQRALKLWHRWEAPRAQRIVTELGQWPRIEDGCVAEPLEPDDVRKADAMFRSHYQDARRWSRQPVLFEGPEHDPTAFTSLDPDLRLYKVTDFQQGLEDRIN